jgi:hypothetical protein
MSAQPPIFKQSGTSALYFLDPEETEEESLLLPAFLSSASGSPPPELEVTQAWNDTGGIYIFLTVRPPDVEVFIREVRELVRGQGYSNTRFLWVLDPGLAARPWVGNRLRAEKRAGNAGDWSVIQTESFNFANYSLTIGAGCAISGPTPGNGYGFSFTPISGAYPNILFHTPWAAFPISSQEMVLPLNVNATGCFTFTLKLSNPGSETAPSDFEQLQVYCAFFIPDPGQNPAGSVRALEYPVLKQPQAGYVLLYVNLDPLNPLQGSRTALSLIDPLAKNPPPPPMKSYFITATGHNISLSPLRGGNGEADARFIFARRPLWTDPSAVPFYYLALEGSFAITIDNPWPGMTSSLVPSERIVCGISGAEYAGLMAGTGNILHFIPGGNAYAPVFANDSAGNGSNDSSLLLTGLGTTSWVYITPPSAQDRIYYYSQPEQALMYNATNITAGSNGSTGHLDFLEVPAAVLPATFPAAMPPAGGTGLSAAAFPMVPYRGINPDDLDYCRRIEYQAISPTRRKVIEDITARLYSSDPVRGTAGSGKTTGVTPQGLIVEMDDNLIDWKRLVLGNTTLTSAPENARFGLEIDENWLQLTNVRGPFRAALQSNQLFLVAADPGVFRSACSVRYRLTEDSFTRLMRLPADKRGPDGILNTVMQKTREGHYPIYDGLPAYQSQLSAWAPDITSYLGAWETEGAYFELAASGWKFLISPYHWFSGSRAQHQSTIMLLKFGHRAMDELIEETGAWPWPEAAKINGSLNNTRDELRSVFDAAKASVARAKENGTPSPYDYFVNQVITNPDWNGVLFLNCQVPLDQLPGQLQGISAGIDKSRFYAHHLGLGITPLSVENQNVQLGSTSLFGLIDYEDPDDLVFSEDTEFDFKVLALTILFENSGIKTFSARIELLICKLFGDLVLLQDSEHGNNLILEGVCQTDNGEDCYSFRQAGVNRYQSENSALETIEILSSRYQTLIPENGPSPQNARITSRFSLGGNLRFTEIDGFDLFSFGPASAEAEPGAQADGYLRFSEFTVDMSYDSADPAQKKSFLPKASGISFELTQSRGRENGLYNKFPLTLTGMVESPVTQADDNQPKGVSPKEMGYSPVSAPLQQGELTYPWYGLAMDLDLGTLGSLADNLGLKLSLLAAWCQTDRNEEPIVYLGMKFPGLSDLGIKLPIEGILSLGFRNIQFLAGETDKGRLYMLRLRQFGIRLLGLSFPPGNNDIYLFGNPDNRSNTKLGWYAAYSGGKEDKEQIIDSRRMLSGRRGRRGAGS